MVTEFTVYGDERIKRAWIDEGNVMAVVQRWQNVVGGPVYFYDLVMSGNVVISVPEEEGAAFVLRWNRERAP